MTLSALEDEYTLVESILLVKETNELFVCQELCVTVEIVPLGGLVLVVIQGAILKHNCWYVLHCLLKQLMWSLEASSCS